MANPFLLMAFLYIGLALLSALNYALAALGLLPWFSGLVWLRAHFVTLGVLTQVMFGMLPLLVASRAHRTRPATRWDIWLTLNAGLVSLLVGIPLVNGTLMIAGGTLVFVAAVLLLKQLFDLRPLDRQTPILGTPEARNFYLASLSFLLLGIFVGTGLYIGWGPLLGMQAPKEVHVHANMWGFTSLVFAGLWVDLYPALTGRSLAWPRSIRWILGLMTVGASGLIIGPWTGLNVITMPSLALHFASTYLLLANIIIPLWRDRSVATPGLFHMIFAYAWAAAPSVLPPLVLFTLPGFQPAAVEPMAISILIFSWLLQFAYGLFPYLFSRVFLPERVARLGGNRVSLFAVNLGTILMVGSAFLEPYAALLSSAAYLAWAVSMVPIAFELWEIVRTGTEQMELKNRPVPLNSPTTFRVEPDGEQGREKLGDAH